MVSSGDRGVEAPLTAPFDFVSRPSRDYESQTLPSQVKSPQQSSVLVHDAPTPPQQNVSLLVGLLGMAQSRFVWFVQHCLFVVHASPKPRGLHFLHFFFFFFAVVSMADEASPTAASVAPPSADRNAMRRVLPPPTIRTSLSNAEPSMASSDLGDARAPPVTTKRRPDGQLTPCPVRRRRGVCG